MEYLYFKEFFVIWFKIFNIVALKVYGDDHDFDLEKTVKYYVSS